MRFLLDSSALLAHLYDEPGAEDVRALFYDSSAEVDLSALSAVELFASLMVHGAGEQFDAIWQRYGQIVDSIRDIDEGVALKAVELRKAAGRRLPNGDALIAATAALSGATLVHRDAHFESIPSQLLTQRLLQDV